MIKTLYISLVFIAFMVFGGCNQSKETEAPEDNLRNNRWVLTSMYGYEIVGPASVKDVTFILSNNDKTFNGDAPCNHYSGTYTRFEENITFSNIIATRMACDLLDMEQKYFENLRRVNKYKIQGDQLFLYDNNTELITFKSVYLY